MAGAEADSSVVVKSKPQFSCFGRMLEKDCTFHFTVKTLWRRHPGEPRIRSGAGAGAQCLLLKNQLVDKSLDSAPDRVRGDVIPAKAGISIMPAEAGTE